MDKYEQALEKYEKLWIYFSLGMITVFIALIAYLMVAHGRTNPVGAGRVDVATVRTVGEFANPRVERIGEEYVAWVLSFVYSYAPAEMRFTAGRRVTFRITSPDVIHSFTIQGTNVNVMVIPGQITEVSHVFDKPGEYRVVCNEYCGIGHANMMSRIIVE
jgi:cytochrome c oxidase subunit 2